jgi:hypothetical protein
MPLPPLTMKKNLKIHGILITKEVGLDICKQNDYFQQY